MISFLSILFLIFVFVTSFVMYSFVVMHTFLVCLSLFYLVVFSLSFLCHVFCVVLDFVDLFTLWFDPCLITFSFNKPGCEEPIQLPQSAFGSRPVPAASSNGLDKIMCPLHIALQPLVTV